MNAAERLFLSEGVAATTIEQITSAAAVAKGTFYLYFSSKDDVLAALADRFAQQLLEKINTAVAKEPAKNWKGKLETWAKACSPAISIPSGYTTFSSTARALAHATD
jgi:AcrR family transcriptional regulator